MLILLNNVHVIDDGIEAFAAASAANARESLKEPGCRSYDVLQSNADPTRFVLHEVYADLDAFHAHKTTPHYETWRDAVAGLMASPRVGVQYHEIETTVL
ncbi:putative quinol monooxygenase [Propionicicella superfundia]|uniref:putative quinol monooxygenase n=1 Tax=Propionicicella superfundia TaxID=348582 RepID=UPI000426574D|nr:putative quinol monooxygenase [Propionicicella superfundia]